MAPSLASFSLLGDTLPADAAAVKFEATERISEPYVVRVDFTTTDLGFVVEDCLRTRLCLFVTGAAGEVRFFDGIVDQARFIHITAETRRFQVRLRPQLAALEHRAGSRIHQDLSIVQVIQKVFDEAGFAEDVEWRITKAYAEREFVVQYRESHLAFVSRLLEENGLFYFFHHVEDGHKMIVSDDSGSFTPDDDAPAVAFGMSQGTGAIPLAQLSRTRSLRNNFVNLRDYDFEKPDSLPESALPTEEAWPLEYFEYPAGFTKSDEGSRLADARMRELRHDADVYEGESLAVGLRVGVPFTVDGAAEPCLNGELVCTDLITRGQQTQSGGQANVAVTNRFRAVPAGAPYASPRRTPKPRIHGVQTAIVTGSSEQEQSIYTEKYGRIKVRFYWDREGQQDHTSSCFMRVSQVAMGGSMILPRVGWEVSVAFLDGDPDRPLVMGRVYNAEKVPPMGLPGAKASGSLKSMSSPGGGGHNELTMSDSGGSQGFGIHAQKDLNVTIGHDKIEEVGVDEVHNVTVSGSSSVGVDQSISVGGAQAIDIGAVLSHNVGGNQSIKVGGNDTDNAISNYVEKVDGDRSYSVGGNQITISNGIRQAITGDFSRNVGAAELIGTIGSINDNILGSLTETVGAIKAQLINGSIGEDITGNKATTYLAAELHLTKGALASQAGGSVTNLVGGLHYQKLAGDYVVAAPMITLVGAVGVFKGGGSEMKLGGGPVTLKGTAITVDSALIVKMGTSMKLGS